MICVFLRRNCFGMQHDTVVCTCIADAILTYRRPIKIGILTMKYNDTNNQVNVYQTNRSLAPGYCARHRQLT